MGDTYARVMRVTDGPGDRRTMRSRAPRRSGALQAPGGTIPPAAVHDSAAGIPAVTAMDEILSGAAEALPSPGGTTRPDIGQAAETTFAAAVTAFMAGRDAQLRRGLVFEDVPAPKRLAPYATAIAATVQRD